MNERDAADTVTSNAAADGPHRCIPVARRWRSLLFASRGQGYAELRSPLVRVPLPRFPQAVDDGVAAPARPAADPDERAREDAGSLTADQLERFRHGELSLDALTVAQWSLLKLHAGHGDQALVDLQAAATVATLLLAGGDYAEDAHQAVQQAVAALESLREGKGSHATAAVACVPLIEVFEQLLRQVTLRRLHAAQDAAAVSTTG